LGEISLDMGWILLHVKFQDGLSISVSRNEAILYQKIGAQNRWVFKKISNFEKPPA
jgi:hypothetical protein